MSRPSHFLQFIRLPSRTFSWGDGVILLGTAASLAVGIRLALDAPLVVQGPEISLAPQALPLYAALSVGRMFAAYTLSLLFALVYGRLAAYNQRAERVMMPLLDVLQSVPILSFLPVVLLSLSAFMPQNIAAEFASIVLIFTSQVWNLAFAWYQSLTTIPKELREASAIFRLNTWMRFRQLELPFAGISLVWNSMMSWAGGWFFLMAAEIFTVGERDFRLPGLGAYLQEAANQGNFQAIFMGLGVLVLVIVALDQLFWRPLLAWSDRFKLTLVADDEPPASWFYEALRSSRISKWAGKRLAEPVREGLDTRILKLMPVEKEEEMRRGGASWLGVLLTAVVVGALLYGLYWMLDLLLRVPARQWLDILTGTLATLGRVFIALALALAWTVPVGVAIGTNRRVAGVLQPVVQIMASLPATALFPVFLLFVLRLPGGLNLAAVLLMLLGTQWYLLFNVIAGASAIPQDLKYTSTLLNLSGWGRWRTLILPALFPYLVTGAITAGGGAWNASIVAEHVTFTGEVYQTTGIGALITQATARGDYPLLLAATLSMILAVVVINRLLWRRLYVLAEEKYRME